MISMFDLNKYLLVSFSREELTGAKFEVKIWTLIGGSCLGHLQTKTMSTLTKKNLLSNIHEEKYTSYVVIRGTSTRRLLSVLRSIE